MCVSLIFPVFMHHNHLILFPVQPFDLWEMGGAYCRGVHVRQPVRVGAVLEPFGHQAQNVGRPPATPPYNNHKVPRLSQASPDAPKGLHAKCYMLKSVFNTSAVFVQQTRFILCFLNLKKSS